MILYTIFGDKRKLLNHIVSVRTYFPFTYIVRTARSNFTRFTYQCFSQPQNLLDFVFYSLHTSRSKLTIVDYF